MLDDVLVRDGFTLLCILGFGFASSFVSRLGSFGEKKIVAFVKAGGGFVGIGSGAYMGANWGYRLLDIDIVDLHHWKRGTTDDCVLQYTPQGQRLVRASAQEVGRAWLVVGGPCVGAVSTFAVGTVASLDGFAVCVAVGAAVDDDLLVRDVVRTLGTLCVRHKCSPPAHQVGGETPVCEIARSFLRLVA